ncbi:MAG: hypothetical protein IT324_07810 [Anaerolineae bacterium]|nr:hypothetical protein [Anaerolineae bacterium]
MTQQNPREEHGTSNILLMFIGGSAVLVAVTLIIFVVILGLGRIPTTSQRSELGPYSVANRLIPTANRLDQLLPDKIGDFKRIAVSGSLPDFKATYARDADKITLTGSQAVSLRAAQASVAQVSRTEGGVSTANQQLNKDPSYYLNDSNKTAVRFVWSHDRWYFDAVATSRQALDDFMRDFKY